MAKKWGVKKFSARFARRICPPLFQNRAAAPGDTTQTSDIFLLKIISVLIALCQLPSPRILPHFLMWLTFLPTFVTFCPIQKTFICSRQTAPHFVLMLQIITFTIAQNQTISRDEHNYSYAHCTNFHLDCLHDLEWRLIDNLGHPPKSLRVVHWKSQLILFKPNIS